MDRRTLIAVVLSGKSKAWAVSFPGDTANIGCGSDAGIDNLADNAFTLEGYFLAVNKATAGYLFRKTNGSTGWSLYFNASGLYTTVLCATTSPNINYNMAAITNSKWFHVAITWDDAGDRKIRMFVDGANVATSGAGSGAIVSDASDNFIIGSPSTSLVGKVGWCRVSNVVRYTTTFTPATRFMPPVVDANTLCQWNMQEGTGTAVDNIGSVGAGADGTINNGAWAWV